MLKEYSFSPCLAIYGVGFFGQELTRLATKRGWRIVAAVDRAGDKIRKDLGRKAGCFCKSGRRQWKFEGMDADVALIAATNRLIEKMWHPNRKPRP